MLDAVALGELLIDFTLTGTGPDGYPLMATHPGGAPANFLAAMARQGASTALLGKVGQDAFGRLLRGSLEKAGVGVRGLVADPAVFTTLAFVTLDDRGEREFSFARKPGADAMLAPEEVDLALIDQARCFHFGSLSLTQEPARSATRAAVAYARQKGKLVTFDPNLRPPLWPDPDLAREQILWGLGQAQVVKLSEEEGRFLFGLPPAQAAQAVRDLGPELVFLTLGEKGCYYVNQNAAGTAPIPAGIRPVDTTGAGDIFGGTAVWKVLETGKAPGALSGAELAAIAQYACAAASLSTQRPGGLGTAPAPAEVARLLSDGIFSDQG